MHDFDTRADLLRTQAMDACLTAMGAAELRQFGTEAQGGTVLDSRDQLTAHSYWPVDGVVWHFETKVTVTVEARPL